MHSCHQAVSYFCVFVICAAVLVIVAPKLKIVSWQMWVSLRKKWIYGEKRFEWRVIFIGTRFRSLEVKLSKAGLSSEIDWSHVVENKKQMKKSNKQRSDQNILSGPLVLVPIETYWLWNLKSFEFKSNKNRNLEKLKWPFWSWSWENYLEWNSD